MPTGVFVARRNGKVFLTGNTGFPKSRSLLKPAAEHWILIKAPGELRELRIDECRTETMPRLTGTKNPHATSGVNGVYGSDDRTDRQQRYDANPPSGRWPANFALSHSDDCTDTCVEDCPVRLLDEQAGERPKAGNTRITQSIRGQSPVNLLTNTKLRQMPVRLDDATNASRFFYVAKASTKERSAGLPDRNSHPTVKSVALMRHLIRLIAAPGSLILDPFTGSGSTAVAALQEGCRFAGIEQDSQHAETARLRTQHAYKHSEEQPCPTIK